MTFLTSCIAGWLAAAPAVSPSDLRANLVATDRAAAIAAVETISLGGDPAAFGEIAGFLAHWSGDKEMEGRGLSALRRLPADIAELLKVLKDDPEPLKRALAAWAIGEHEIAEGGDGLLAALKDADGGVRGHAAGALGVLADPRAHDPLMKLVVHDPDPAVRRHADEALAKLGVVRPAKAAIAPFVEKLGSVDPFQRLEGAKALEKTRDRRAVAPLLALLQKERDVEVRRAAVAALAAMHDEIAVPALIEIARTDSAPVRPYAIAALATLDDPRAIAPLAAMAKDPVSEVRKFALRALSFLDRTGCLPALLDALADPVPEVRGEAMKGIAKVATEAGKAEEAADRVAARLEIDPDSGLRTMLAATLGTLGTIGKKSHEKALLRALDDDDGAVKMAAAAALAKIGTKTCEKPLRKTAERESKKKQGEADLELIRIAEDAARQVSARP